MRACVAPMANVTIHEITFFKYGFTSLDIMPSEPFKKPTKENLRNVLDCKSCSFISVNYKTEAVYDFETTKVCPECGGTLHEKAIDEMLDIVDKTCPIYEWGFPSNIIDDFKAAIQKLRHD